MRQKEFIIDQLIVSKGEEQKSEDEDEALSHPSVSEERPRSLLGEPVLQEHCLCNAAKVSCFLNRFIQCELGDESLQMMDCSEATHLLVVAQGASGSSGNLSPTNGEASGRGA